MTAGILLAGCGGGSSATSGPPPPTGNFSLSLSSPNLNIAGGTSGSVSVSVAGSGGFSGGVTFTVSGAPSAITVSPTSFELTAGQSQQITFTAPSYVSASTSSITIDGNSGPGYDHSTTLSLQVSPYQGNISLSRTKYVPTDAVSPNTVIFDSNTNRFIMSDPGSNRVMFIDAATRTEVGTVTVPGAYGMDETPDHTTLYAGTVIGDVYAVDPVGMKVTQRYIASQIGPSGYQAASVRVLASGKLVLIPEGLTNPVDGFNGFAIWDPTDNTLALYQGGNTNPVGPCVGDEDVEVTADRNSVILVGPGICVVNTISGQVNSAAIPGFPVIATPDGQALLVLQGGFNGHIVLLNPQTLEQTSSFPIAGNDDSYVAVSPDSSTVYVAPEEGGIVYGYNIASGGEAGWMPDISMGGVSVIGTWISAVDNTGLVAGVTVEGMGLLDGAALRTGPVGTAFGNGYLNPATGPIAGGTGVTTELGPSSNLDAVYFGPNLATSLSAESGLLVATTPPGSPGPVDVYSLVSDGGVLILPEAYSYGPSIVEATTSVSTADGGGTGEVFGFGFGSTMGANGVIPSGLTVSVGGQTAQVTGYNLNPYGDYQPTPIESVSFTVPPGTAGSSADIAVSSQSGTTTLSAGMQYLPAVQQIPLTGAVLAQGIYDATRDLYYFTDAAEIRVYSRSEAQWLAPIQAPAAPSGLTHRLWGIALSPNGSQLAVSDASAGMVYLINPDATSSVQSFNLNPLGFQGNPINAAGLAVSDGAVIYVTTSAGELKIDAGTGQISNYGVNALGNSLMSRAAISGDNSRVFFNEEGEVFSVDTATDTMEYASIDPTCCYGDDDLTLASGQTTVEATSYLYDLNLNAESYLAPNDREAVSASYVYGTKLSPDGTLLFQPTTNGIDVYDGRLGTFRERIALPFALSQNFDALVSDGQDNVLIAITGQTGSGIAIVDLSSLSEPPALAYEASRHGQPSNVGGHEQPMPSAPNANVLRPARSAIAVPRTSIRHVTNAVVLNTPLSRR